MATVAEIEDAIAKLPPEDFDRLMENLRDLQIAREALAEIAMGEKPTSWERLQKELDAVHS